MWRMVWMGLLLAQHGCQWMFPYTGGPDASRPRVDAATLGDRAAAESGVFARDAATAPTQDLDMMFPVGPGDVKPVEAAMPAGDATLAGDFKPTDSGPPWSCSTTCGTASALTCRRLYGPWPSSPGGGPLPFAICCVGLVECTCGSTPCYKGLITMPSTTDCSYCTNALSAATCCNAGCCNY
jgi:hypothetical protein